MHSSDPSSFLGPGPDYVSQIIGRIGTKLEKHVLDGHRRHFIGIHLKRVPLITFTSHALQKPNDDKVAFGRRLDFYDLSLSSCHSTPEHKDWSLDIYHHPARHCRSVNGR